MSNSDNTKKAHERKARSKKQYIERERGTRVVGVRIGPAADADLKAIKDVYKSILGFEVSHSAIYRRCLRMLATYLRGLPEGPEGDRERRGEASRLMLHLSSETATLNPARAASLRFAVMDEVERAEALLVRLQGDLITADDLAEANAFLAARNFTAADVPEARRAAAEQGVRDVAEAVRKLNAKRKRTDEGDYK